MSYEAAQHTLTIAFNALATTPLLVAVIKMSVAVMFPATAQAQAQAQAQDDTSWESIWATADAIGARYADGGVYAPEPASEPVAVAEPAPASDYGAIVIDLVAESADMGLDTAPVQTPDEWSIAFAEELMGRKKADLLTMAGTIGFSLSKKLTKAEIVAAIVAGQPC